MAVERQVADRKTRELARALRAQRVRHACALYIRYAASLSVPTWANIANSRYQAGQVIDLVQQYSVRINGAAASGLGCLSLSGLYGSGPDAQRTAWHEGYGEVRF